MSFGDGDLHVQVAQLKTENARLKQQIDAMPGIVRCRDCRAMRVKYGNTGIECWMNGEPFTVEPDGFCAWASKRKDDGE